MNEHLDLTGDVIRALRAFVDAMPNLSGLSRFVTNLEVRHAAMKAASEPAVTVQAASSFDRGPQPDHTAGEQAPNE